MENGLLALADDSCHRGLFAPAIATYLHIVRSLPQSDSFHQRAKSSLIVSLCNWALVSDLDRQSYQLLIKGYQDALRVCPVDKDLLNNYGDLIFRLGYHTESLAYFRQALVLSSNFLKAQENLDNACGKVAERWHFRMLNDVIRNSAFRSAIDSAIERFAPTAVDDKLIVLDIGAGAGLLSLFLAQSLATRGLCPEVYSCEMSASMFKMARDIFAARKLSDVVKMINKRSNDLTIPGDIPYRSRVVVTETFDCGLLGEHIMCTLSHAWKYLLSCDSQSVVVPRAAVVYVTAIQSDAIRQQNRYLNDVQGIDTRGVGILCSTACDWSRFESANDRHCCDKNNAADCNSDLDDNYEDGDDNADGAEPYTSERLIHLRGGFKFLSSPTPLLSFNFTNMQEVIDYAQGVSRDLNVVINEEGRLDALVVWFDLHLDEHIAITTSPLATDLKQAKCWEQAVYPVISTHINTEESLRDILVGVDDNLTIRAEIKHALHLKCTNIARRDIRDVIGQTQSRDVSRRDIRDVIGPTQSRDVSRDDASFESNFESRDAKVSTTQSRDVSDDKSRDEIFSLSRESVGKLNDVHLVQSCVTSLVELRKCYQGDCGSKFKLAVLTKDLFLFPIVCLRSDIVDEVCFIGLNQTRKNIVHRLSDLNGIDLSRILFLDHSSECPANDYQVLWIDIIDSGGPMVQHILEDVALARLSLLSSNGRLMPTSLSLHGLLIQSNSLLDDCSVTSGATFEFDDVSTLFNKLRMKSHYNIELSTLDYTPLTEPTKLLSINLNESAVDCFTATRLTNTVCVTASKTSAVTALVYWFEIRFTDCVLVTTSDARCHWLQAAVLFYDEISVTEGDRYTISTTCDNSYIGVELMALGNDTV